MADQVREIKSNAVRGHSNGRTVARRTTTTRRTVTQEITEENAEEYWQEQAEEGNRAVAAVQYKIDRISAGARVVMRDSLVQALEAGMVDGADLFLE